MASCRQALTAKSSSIDSIQTGLADDLAGIVSPSPSVFGTRPFPLTQDHVLMVSHRVHHEEKYGQALQSLCGQLSASEAKPILDETIGLDVYINALVDEDGTLKNGQTGRTFKASGTSDRIKVFVGFKKKTNRIC